MTIQLGDTVKDKITGFQGIVVCRTEWLYGCIRLTVQPRKLVKGEAVGTRTFDEPQLELVEAGTVVHKLPVGDLNYGPRDDKAATSRN